MIRNNVWVITAMAILVSALSAGQVYAHCDTLDGPVVKDAKLALEKGDVTPVLKWIKPEFVKEIKEAFEKTLKVRIKGDDAQELADRYFFETLVRVHRAGESAPYTGLKPAGQVEPMVKHLDGALEKGTVDSVTDKVAAKVKANIKERFEKVLETRKHADEDVEKGRAFVEAYVVFMHYVEGIHKAVNRQGHESHAE